MTETVVFLSSLVIQLAPSRCFRGTGICPSAGFTVTFGFTQAFVPRSPTVLSHVVQKHQLVCHASSVTIYLPRTQTKDLRLCCDFQFLRQSGLPSACLLEAGRNSREDLQIQTLALSKRKVRKIRTVYPSAVFLSMMLSYLLSLWLLLLQDLVLHPAVLDRSSWELFPLLSLP